MGLMSAEKHFDGSKSVSDGLIETTVAIGGGILARYIWLMGAGAISFNPILFGALITAATVTCAAFAIDGARRIFRGLHRNAETSNHAVAAA